MEAEYFLQENKPKNNCRLSFCTVLTILAWCAAVSAVFSMYVVSPGTPRLRGVRVVQRNSLRLPLQTATFHSTTTTSKMTPLGASRAKFTVCAKMDKEAIQKHADEVLESDKILIAPAIQTANLAMLGPEIDAAMKGGADVVHCDIMDGHFTEKLTFGPMFVKGLRKYGITAPIDVHLMADGIVDHLVKEFADAGANYITFHPEGTKHIDRSLSMIKDHGLKCGIVINPGTPLSYLDSVMDKVDMILLMSVNPGFKNQKFQDITYKKAREIKKMINATGRKIRLEVDGRVGEKNIEKLTEAGIDMFVVGGSIFNADDYGVAISNLRKLAESAVSKSDPYFSYY